MTSVSKRRTGFTVSSLYRRTHERLLDYMSERATFWIAALSVLAFVTGNMVGQNGWHVFWKSVLGEGSEASIVFTGTVTPIELVPDFGKWAAYGGDPRVDTFRQVPRDALVPLPAYTLGSSESSLEQRIYAVKFLGTYDTGRGEGSHPGVDIDTPVGTPIRSIANGVVQTVGNDQYGFGIYVVVKHPNVPDSANPGKTQSIYSVYAHLSAAGVVEGQMVQKGEQIALSGKTGDATGPHLHFQVDKDTAPWHPYWPFTSAEARAAGESVGQAVNSGLHRERGLEYTVDPMVFVQAYVNGAPVTVAAHSSSSSAVPSKNLKNTIADRRSARLARLTVNGTTLIAYTEEAPVAPIPSHSAASAESSSSDASVSSEVPATRVQDVSTVRIEMNDSRTREREWKSVTLILVDDNGDAIKNPAPGRKMALRPAFGKAEIKPSAFSTGDFVNGRLTVQVLPQGSQTLVLEVVPFGVLSKPMKMER